MRPGTDKLLAKAVRAAAAGEAAVLAGRPALAAARALTAMLSAARARLNEAGLRPRSHARAAALYAARPPLVEAPPPWLAEALALRVQLAEDDTGLDERDVARLVERAVSFAAAVKRAVESGC
ncbi:MAG: hypothetical protein AB7V27_13535 [Candidatus Binatia bacterium]